MADRGEGGVRDSVAGWGEEVVPAQQDRVPSAWASARRPLSRARGRVARVVLVAGLVLAAVVPAMLCVRAWHEAESIRGIGEGRGVFTVDSCGDPRVVDDGGDPPRQHTEYTCTGTFDGVSASGVQASVNSWHDDQPGARRPARIVGGHVSLRDDGVAALMMAVWFTAACCLAYFQARLLLRVERRIRGAEQQNSLAGELGSWLFFVLIIGPAIFTVALLPLVVLFRE